MRPVPVKIMAGPVTWLCSQVCSVSRQRDWRNLKPWKTAHYFPLLETPSTCFLVVSSGLLRDAPSISNWEPSCTQWPEPEQDSATATSPFCWQKCVTWMGINRLNIRIQNPRRPGEELMKLKWNQLSTLAEVWGQSWAVCLMWPRQDPGFHPQHQNKTKTGESCLLPVKLVGKGQTGCLQSLFKRKKNQELNQEKGHS